MCVPIHMFWSNHDNNVLANLKAFIARPHLIAKGLGLIIKLLLHWVAAVDPLYLFRSFLR